MPLALVAYRTLTRLATPAAGLILGLRARRGKEDRIRSAERYGRAAIERPDGPLAWVHAASVGETSAILPLISRLRAARPDVNILLTTGTVTSGRFVADRLPEGVIHQYIPLDAPAFIARFLDHWRPSLAILTEQEIWPNLLTESRARSIPLALVNARMSRRSFERWHRRLPIAAALFSCFSVVVAQSPALAERFRGLGAGNTVIAGNLKVDAPPPPVDGAAKQALEQALAGRPRLVASSTHEGEERVLAAAHREIRRRHAGFCTIIAPRHPERGPAIAEAMKAEGLSVASRSLGALPGRDADIYLADTIGELGTLYASTSIAFIGGSLIPHGGQNPIEAVRHGAAVLTGASWTNFADITEHLVATGGAMVVTDAAGLAAAVDRLLTDADLLNSQRERARQALGALSGALDRTAAAMLSLLPAPERSLARAV